MIPRSNSALRSSREATILEARALLQSEVSPTSRLISVSCPNFTRLLPRFLTGDLLQSVEDGIGHLARSGRAIQIWGPDLRPAEHLLDGRDHARSGVLVPEVI
jgi:hypothetical protein